MKYRELIKKIQHDSGFSDQESRDALQMLIESIAVRLTEGERKDFASQLPEELEDLALSVRPTPENNRDGLIEQFMEIEGIEEDHAKKQVLSAWQALKAAITPGQIDHIKTQLPDRVAEQLH